jgi:hypothetical protein
MIATLPEQQATSGRAGIAVFGASEQETEPRKKAARTV